MTSEDAQPTVEIGFVIPGDIDLPTGGYTYDRRMMALLPRFGVNPRHVALPSGYPFPTPAILAESERMLQALPPRMPLLIDGLAFGAMPAEMVARIPQPIIALVHHPLYLETGLDPEQKQRFHMSERMALAFARHVIGVSQSTLETVAQEFGVPRARMTLASPGTDAASRAIGSGAAASLHILSVGSIVPRKAYDVLIRALAMLADTPWRLTIAGSRTLSPAANDALERALQETGLGPRVRILGALPQAELDALYNEADLFVLASLHEGFGMVLTEALARGLPIVCTTGGAAADTVPDSAALKVAPGDAAALAQAITKLANDPQLRRTMSDAAWDAAQKLWRWEDTARMIAGAVKRTVREAT